MSVIKEYPLDSSYFAEGTTILNNKIYQLTWLENKMFVYSTDLVLLDVVTITNPVREGWGLCNDGYFLYISDGSSYIHKMDPNSYKILNSIRVHQGTKYIGSINELEWVNGEIWANIYYSKYFVRINPDNGDVLGWVNLTGLEAAEDAFWYAGYVLNGIAVYNGRIFVTGKCWKHLYEIELVYYEGVTDVPRIK
jgi:glutamine cyclotransferase